MGIPEFAMVKSIGSPNAELRSADPNNPSQGPHPTNGYLKNLSEMHGYHKWVPLLRSARLTEDHQWINDCCPCAMSFLQSFLATCVYLSSG